MQTVSAACSDMRRHNILSIILSTKIMNKPSFHHCFCLREPCLCLHDATISVLWDSCSLLSYNFSDWCQECKKETILSLIKEIFCRLHPPNHFSLLLFLISAMRLVNSATLSVVALATGARGGAFVGPQQVSNDLSCIFVKKIRLPSGIQYLIFAFPRDDTCQST